MLHYDKWVTRVSTALAVVAAALLLAATLVITWMVFARTMGIHSFWELELSIELMISAIFLGSPYTLASGGHVRMDLLSFILPPQLQTIVSFTAKLAGFLICFYLGWKGLGLAYNAFISGERGLGIWEPLVWPRYATIPIGMFWTCAQYVVFMRSEVRTTQPAKLQESTT